MTKLLAAAYYVRVVARLKKNDVDNYVSDVKVASQLEPNSSGYLRNYLMGLAEQGKYVEVSRELPRLRKMNAQEASDVEVYMENRRKR